MHTCPHSCMYVVSLENPKGSLGGIKDVFRGCFRCVCASRRLRACMYLCLQIDCKDLLHVCVDVHVCRGFGGVALYVALGTGLIWKNFRCECACMCECLRVRVCGGLCMCALVCVCACELVRVCVCLPACVRTCVDG